MKFLLSQIWESDLSKRCLAMGRLAKAEALKDDSAASEEVSRSLADVFHNQPSKDINSNEITPWLLWCLVELGRFPIAGEEIEPLLDHLDGYVCASSMTYLSRAFPDRRVSILKTGLSNPIAVVRMEACSEIGSMDLRELENDVKRLLVDTDQCVVNAANICLEFFEIHGMQSKN